MVNCYIQVPSLLDPYISFILAVFKCFITFDILMLATQGREGCEAVPVPILTGRQNIFRAPMGWVSFWR